MCTFVQFFNRLKDLSLLSAGGRMDFDTMSAPSLLAYHHPYGLLILCQKYPYP